MKYFYLTTSIVLGFSFLSLAEQNSSIDLKAWYKQFKNEKPIDNDSLIRFTNQKLIELEGFHFNSIDKQEEKEKYKGHLNLWLGTTYRNINQNELALESYENAIKFYQFSGYSKGSLGDSYMNAASVYRLKKDFVKSNAYYEAAERIYKENKKYIDLFDVYLEQINNYNLEGLSPFNPNIIKLYQKAKQIEEIDEWKKISLELNVTCQQFVEKEKYDDAITIIDNAIKVFEDTEVAFRKSKHPYADYMLNLKTEHLIVKAEFLIKKIKRYDEAKRILDKVDHLIKTKSIDLRLYNKEAYLLLTKAAYHTALQQYHQAQQYHQQILQFINPLFTYQTIHQNPSPNQIFGNPYLLTTLADKAEIFKKMYHQDKDKANLTQALACYQLSYIAADEMRKNYSFEEANTFMSGYTYSFYEKAIELCQTLAKAFPAQENKYQQKAFEIAQRSSMKTLFWEINSRWADNNLPQAFKAKRKELQKHITKLEYKLNGETKTAILKTELFEKRQQLDKTTQQLEATDTLYAYNKFRPLLIEEKTIQNSLQPNEAVLNYFFGDSLIYCFYFTKNKSQIIEIESPKLIAENIIAFRKQIGQDKNTNNLGLQLYQQLLENILTKQPQINKLIIIPDGILNALPFEALQKTHKAQDYLIHQYTISYDLHSYFIGNRLENTSTRQINVAGFGVEDFSNWAPFELSNLSYSNDEIESAVKQISGTSFPAANKQQFLQHFSKYPIVHISTHATADTLNAAKARIFFSRNNESNLDDMLYRNEILNLECQADLIVLSACQTGLGVQNKGEGIASLARAFRTIGSKSEVMSLWSVTDFSTAEILKAFYKNLKTGSNKSEALRKAKLHFLQNAKANFYKSPYYWAGLVLQGDDNSLF